MKPDFTIEGVEVQTFQEIFDELATGFKDIYGQDIDLSPDTPDGQRIGIEAKARLDMQTFGLALYAQFDPDFASGEVLNKIIKLVGLARRPATRSTVDCTVTTDRDLTLATGFIVEDDAGQEWITLDDQALVTGANTVTFWASEFGTVSAGVNTITEPVIIVQGVTAVTNPLAATAGLDEETDEALRIRRNKSLENASYSTVAGLFAKLANITAVTDLVVYENDSDSYDAVKDMLANSIWVVIDGGAVADIAESITKNKTAGVSLKGTELATFLEVMTKPNGSSFTYTHEIKFDRPVAVPLYITVTATRKDATQPIDLELIKEKILEKLFSINESVVASELYSFGYQAGTNFILTDLLVSDNDIDFVDDKIDNEYGEKFTIDLLNIDVTEVI